MFFVEYFVFRVDLIIKCFIEVVRFRGFYDVVLVGGAGFGSRIGCVL